MEKDSIVYKIDHLTKHLRGEQDISAESENVRGRSAREELAACIPAAAAA
jgi:hypothetical protein